VVVRLAHESSSLLLWRSRSWKDVYCVCEHTSTIQYQANLFGYRSLVIDKLEQIRASSPNMGLAYIYCDYRDQTLQTAKNISGTILKQLLRLLPKIPEEIIAIWQKSYNGKTPLEFDQAIEALRITCKSFNRTYICLDALDECQHIDLLLKSLPQAPSPVRLFSTGRKHIQPTIQRFFGHTHMILIEAKESDIRIFIEKSMKEDREKDPELMNERLEQDIIEKIAALSKGMFVIIQYTKCIPVNYIIDFFCLYFILALFLKREPYANVEKL
jgi:hypothetical protein